MLLCLYIIYIRADAAILRYYITSCRGDYVYIRMSYTYISLYFVYIIHQKVKYARLFLVVDFFFMKFIFFFSFFKKEKIFSFSWGCRVHFLIEKTCFFIHWEVLCDVGPCGCGCSQSCDVFRFFFFFIEELQLHGVLI